jgi:cytochrome P450
VTLPALLHLSPSLLPSFLCHTQQEPGLDDLPHFPYVEAVINEALRTYPPAHTTNRDSTSPTGCTITGADGRRWHIPPGSWVHFNIWGLHHNEEHWPQPYTFR